MGFQPKRYALSPGELVLGKSLSGFMRKLGMEDRSGSPRGDRTRLRNQMKRLFGCSVSLIYEDAHGEARVSSLVADRAAFWWNKRKPDEPVLWDSKIRLGEDFFNEIINHPVPLDMNTLKALKRSTLGLDLYLWLNYRNFALCAPLRLTWRQVYCQFGAHPDKASDKRTVLNFRSKVLRELKKIKMAWAGVELLDGSGPPDRVSLNTGYRSAQSRRNGPLIFRLRPLSVPSRPRWAGLDL